jgi:hypothetical protein
MPVFEPYPCSRCITGRVQHLGSLCARCLRDLRLSPEVAGAETRRLDWLIDQILKDNRPTVGTHPDGPRAFIDQRMAEEDEENKRENPNPDSIDGGPHGLAGPDPAA